MVQDRFARGLLDGLIAGLAKLAFSNLFFFLGTARTVEIHRGAAIFLDSWTGNVAAFWLVGLAAHFTFSVLYGLLFSWLLSLTGDDFVLMKGLAIGLIGWLASGVLARLMGTHAFLMNDAGSEAVWFVSHIVFGSLLALTESRVKRRIAH